MRTLIFAAAMLLLGATPALAAPCHGANGKFVKCPTTAAAKPIRCKDAKGKFAKCSAPGAVPIK